MQSLVIVPQKCTPESFTKFTRKHLCCSPPANKSKCWRPTVFFKKSHGTDAPLGILQNCEKQLPRRISMSILFYQLARLNLLPLKKCNTLATGKTNKESKIAYRYLLKHNLQFKHQTKNLKKITHL